MPPISLFFLGILFFIDSLALYLTGELFTQAVLCFTLAALLYKGSRIPFMIGFLMLAFEAFIAYDIFGITSLYIVPLCIITIILDYFLSSRYTVAYISLGTGLVLHHLFLALFKPFVWPLSHYTFLSISVSIITLYMCLKCFPTAKRGNRF